MHYTLLIRAPEEAFAMLRDSATHAVLVHAVDTYLKVLRNAGVYVCGAAFRDPATATSFVPCGIDDWCARDGPYAEAGTQPGGVIVLSVIDRDDALRWARRCPVLPGYVLELRPSVASSSYRPSEGRAAGALPE